MNRPNLELGQTTTPSVFMMKALPLYALALGAAIIAMTFGADLIGISMLLAVVPRRPLLVFALTLATIGAVADLASRQRHLLSWLQRIALDWKGLLKFLAITMQLGLLIVVMRLTYLEHSAFYNNVLTLTFYGFIIHHFLPQAYRLLFFTLLSLGGIFGVFGPPDGAWLVGIGLALIGICHLPIPIRARVAILLLVTAVLGGMRLGYLHVPWTKAIWPILASMFMFRLIVYLYDLAHQTAPVSIARTLSFFFMLPNVAFPLFSVVDYSTFCRTYYDDDQYRIYQRGLRWMVWGVIHLLLYRYINYYWIIDAADVRDTRSLIQYMASSYLLILRISGQFHIVIGILHLFGFGLPRIMNRFLLATAFTDFWRRANVYWCEFMQKIFYYPVYFALRRYGNTTRLVLATSVVFVMTWLLHAYQWLWIRGSYTLSGPDILFWASLGVLVLANSLYEANHARGRTLSKQRVSLGDIATRALRAAGIFVVIMVLWSLWISGTLGDWFSLFDGVTLSWPSLLLALALLVGALAAGMLVCEKWPLLAGDAVDREVAFGRAAVPAAIAIVVLYCFVQPQVYSQLGPTASHLIADLRTNRLNERDEAVLQRGYYEPLSNVHAFNSPLWELYAQRSDDWRPLVETRAVRRTRDLLRYELRPSLDGSFKDAPFTTNRWGMRDIEYERVPPANTYRIAMLGGSVEMGSGVVHRETFEYVLEQRLNEQHAGGKYSRYEILNFSVGGYHLLQQLITLDRKVWAFQPAALFYVVHGGEEGRELFKSPLTPETIDPEELPYQELREILYRAGIKRGMETEEAVDRLESFSDDILLWGYRRVVEQCRQRGIVPLWICLPTWPGVEDTARIVRLVPIAERAGFHALNLSAVYEGAKGAYLQLAPWDKHPNGRGHRLIAEGLYGALLRHEASIPLGLASAAPRVSSSQPH